MVMNKSRTSVLRNFSSEERDLTTTSKDESNDEELSNDDNDKTLTN
jgi:hypothetical protein